MWRNDTAHFGAVSRLLHWVMAALVLALLALGLLLVTTKPTLATLWLYGLHKTMGITALVLLMVRLIWHRASPPPAPLGAAAALPNRLARLVHGAIYLLLLAIPVTGWVASSATGLDVVIFNRFILPPIAPVSPAIETWGFYIHHLLTRCLMGLLLAHVGGALLRGWKGDGTLGRMIGGAGPRP